MTSNRSQRSSDLWLAGATEESTAAGIYGLIVSAAVMAASPADSAAVLVVVVLATLVIYWGAERYARLVAERIHSGHRLDWTHARRQLTSGWEFVTASVLPLAALVIVRVVGVDLETAVLVALGCNTLLLCLHGWEMGRLGHLTRLERVATTTVAGLFGVLLIALKTTLH